MTQSAMQFEQMITAMRKRLRPNGARLLADWLRICVGLSYKAQSGDNGDRRLGFMAGGQKNNPAGLSRVGQAEERAALLDSGIGRPYRRH